MALWESRSHSGSIVPALSLPLTVLVSLILLTSCGNGDEDVGTPATTVTPRAQVASSLPKRTVPAPNQQLLPCHVVLTAPQTSGPVAEPTPEVIRIELQERPYRIVPSDIVLRQNRWYRFVIQAGSEWHSFRVLGMGMRVDYEIPPGEQKAPLVHTTNSGVFRMVNWRHWRTMSAASTITVVPEGYIAATWYPKICGHLEVQGPAPGASLSTPLVIQGSITRPTGTGLNIARIEAWANGEKVGQTTSEQFIDRGSHKDFLLTIPELPPGSHSLLLQAYHLTSALVANVTMPLTILPDPPNTSPSGRYEGSIDTPNGDGLHSLPLTIQGWAVIRGSRNGTGVGAVEIWNGSREGGQFLAEASYGIYRPDVAQVLGDPRLASSGFYAQLHSLPAGPVELHLYVRDRQTGNYVSPPLFQSPLTRRVSLAEGKVTDAAWPVALAAAPDGRLFFAELLNGRIRILQDGEVIPEPFAILEKVSNFGESGFLGLTLHPDFPQTPYVYAMYVFDDPATGYPLGQRVVRFSDIDGVGRDRTVILDNLPATTTFAHNGGRLKFGPDGKLYISIGDTDVPEFSQDPSNLAGSILRYNPDGSIPEDNPIPGSPVYAMGLRNVFGFAFQPGTGSLYATENGPGGFDEVNKIEAGRNYGWPTHMGVSETEGFVDPVAVFGVWPEDPIGPTGSTFTTEQPDLLLFCAYNGFLLRALKLSGPDFTTVESEKILSNNCALDVTYSSDGWLYYSTLSAIYRARLDDLLLLYEQSTE